MATIAESIRSLMNVLEDIEQKDSTTSISVTDVQKIANMLNKAADAMAQMEPVNEAGLGKALGTAAVAGALGAGAMGAAAPAQAAGPYTAKQAYQTQAPAQQAAPQAPKARQIQIPNHELLTCAAISEQAAYKLGGPGRVPGNEANFDLGQRMLDMANKMSTIVLNQNAQKGISGPTEMDKFQYKQITDTFKGMPVNILINQATQCAQKISNYAN